MITLSVSKAIRKSVLRFERGEPFTNKRFLKLGSRAAVDKALSRLVGEGVINRIMPGVFMRPKKSRYISNVMPDVSRVVEVIAKDNDETIQVHGAEAARRFKLSTQMPITPVFYTSGPSRELKIGKLTVRLTHASHRKLLLSGKRAGVALSALWYLGKNNMNEKAVNKIKAGLSPEEFESLKEVNIPAWMARALRDYGTDAINA